MHLEKGTAFHVCCCWLSLLQFVLQTLRILWRYLLKAFPADVSCLPSLYSKVFAPVLWLPTKKLKQLELHSVLLNAKVNKAIILLNANWSSEAAPLPIYLLHSSKHESAATWTCSRESWPIHSPLIMSADVFPSLEHLLHARCDNCWTGDISFVYMLK